MQEKEARGSDTTLLGWDTQKAKMTALAPYQYASLCAETESLRTWRLVMTGTLMTGMDAVRRALPNADGSASTLLVVGQCVRQYAVTALLLAQSHVMMAVLLLEMVVPHRAQSSLDLHVLGRIKRMDVEEYVKQDAGILEGRALLRSVTTVTLHPATAALPFALWSADIIALVALPMIRIRVAQCVATGLPLLRNNATMVTPLKETAAVRHVQSRRVGRAQYQHGEQRSASRFAEMGCE